MLTLIGGNGVVGVVKVGVCVYTRVFVGFFLSFFFLGMGSSFMFFGCLFVLSLFLLVCVFVCVLSEEKVK